MIKFELSQVIDRPVREVFEWVADVETHQQWMAGVEECHWTSEAPHGVGSTCRTVRRIVPVPGAREISESMFTRYEPDRRVSLKTFKGRGFVEISMMFEPAGRGTRCDVTVQVRSALFIRPLQPILGLVIKRLAQASVENLRKLLEERPVLDQAVSV